MATSRLQKEFRYGGDFASLHVERAEGTYIYTTDDRKILDFTSGQMSAILGHSHPEIAAVVATMARELDHLHSSFLSVPVMEFADKLSNILPSGLDRVLPLSTGGEANEACAGDLPRTRPGPARARHAPARALFPPRLARDGCAAGVV